MKPPKRHPLSERANNYLLYQCFFQGFKSISFIKLYHNIKTKHTISSLQIIINFKVISIYQIQNIQFHYFSNFIDGKFTNQYQFLSCIKISKKVYRYNYTTFSLSSMANADISLLNDNTLYTYFDVLLIYEAWIQIYVLAGRSKFFWNALASRMSVRKSLCFHPEVFPLKFSG